MTAHGPVVRALLAAGWHRVDTADGVCGAVGDRTGYAHAKQATAWRGR